MAQNVRVIPCDICDATDDVNSFCVNCKQNYCNICKRGHLRSVSSKHHKFLSIGDGLLASKRQADTCAKHNEQVQFFCKTCGKATCSACVTGKHKKHDFDLITEMVVGVREQLNKNAARKEEEIEKISQQLSATTIAKRYTDNSKKNILTIKQITSDWVKGIQAFEKELIDHQEKEATFGIQRDELGVKKSEEKTNEC